MRKFIEIIENRYLSLHERNVALIGQCSESDLYRKPESFKGTYSANSLGELVLRSGAVVEQTFGGLTAKLWDDPFEWTLPEQLSSRAKVIEHLEEIDGLRRRGFEYLISDDDLLRTMPAPEKIRSIGEILIDAISVAENFNGRAVLIHSFNLGNSGKLDFN